MRNNKTEYSDSKMNKFPLILFLYFQHLINKILIIIDSRFFKANNCEFYKDLQIDYSNFEEYLAGQNVDMENVNNEFDIISKKIKNNIMISGSKIPFIYNADSTLSKICFCLTRIYKPLICIETGIGNGVTAAFILNAIKINKFGRLTSLDLPQVKNIEFVGCAIDRKLKKDWSCFFGLSFIRLKIILKRSGKINMFLHDSANIYHIQKYEINLAYKYLEKNGIIIVNNISKSKAFINIINKYRPSKYFIVRQNEKLGDLTGVIIK